LLLFRTEYGIPDPLEQRRSSDTDTRFALPQDITTTLATANLRLKHFARTFNARRCAYHAARKALKKKSIFFFVFFFCFFFFLCFALFFFLFFLVFFLFSSKIRIGT